MPRTPPVITRLLRRLRGYHPDRVPGAETAVAEESKFRDYLLNPEHPQGQHKARLLWALGFDLDNWRTLQETLLAELPYVPGRFTKVNLANPPGENYEAVMTIKGPTGMAELVTAWAVNPGHPTRLVTLYK